MIPGFEEAPSLMLKPKVSLAKVGDPVPASLAPLPLGFVLGALMGWFYGRFRTPALSVSGEPEGPDAA